MNISAEGIRWRRFCLLINETLLVQDYLEGKGINKSIIYRICFLLTKWYKEHGCSSKLEIRSKIFEWANFYGVFIPINLNDCISKALENPRRLTSDNPIRVNDEDVLEITKRFDRQNVRLVALALLCYAKQFANQDNEFKLPITAFGDWIGIAYNNVAARYMPEIIDFGFVSKGESQTRSWRGSAKSESPTFRMCFPIENSGRHILQGNDVRKLYQEIFDS